ncbi:MAG: hypothetical protein ACOYKJ_02150 [Candidatus Howiella sp.]|jgi:hypothetical protein
MKRNTGKVALCGVLSALSVAIMLFSYLPSMTYAVPAVAGMVFIILVVETDYKWAFTAFGATSVLVLLLAEPEAKLMFVAFFGYYPILKGIIEKLRRPAFEYGLKFLIFNVVMVAAYLLIIFVFQTPVESMGDFGKYSLWVLWGLGNLTFFVYDFAVTCIVSVYVKRLHPRLKRLIR